MMNMNSTAAERLISTIVEHGEKREKMRKHVEAFSHMKAEGPFNIIFEFAKENEGLGMIRLLYSLAVVKYINLHYEEIYSDVEGEEVYDKELLQYCAVFSGMVTEGEMKKAKDYLVDDDADVLEQYWMYKHYKIKPDLLNEKELRFLKYVGDCAFSSLFKHFFNEEED